MKIKRQIVTIWILVIVMGISGCHRDKDVGSDNVESTENIIQMEPIGKNNLEKEKDSEEQEEIISDKGNIEEITDEISEKNTESEEKPVSTKEIEYGDKINITYYRNFSGYIPWETAESCEFKVSTDSLQFQNEFDLSEEKTMKQINKVIGKTVGDTFVLWFEGGDGLYGYEYTISDVLSSNEGIVESGDKIYTSFRMYGYGVDTGDGNRIFTGDQILKVSETDAFMSSTEYGYSDKDGEVSIKNIVGKKIGDVFELSQDSYEHSYHYKYKIYGIEKAVKYGDVIKAEVRRAFIPAGYHYNINETSVSLDLKAEDGCLSFDDRTFSLEESRTFCRELLGKKEGDSVTVAILHTNSDEVLRYVYHIKIDSIEKEMKNSYTGVPDYMEVLMLTDEEKMICIKESLEELEPVVQGYVPKNIYIFIKDVENKFTYEYDLVQRDGTDFYVFVGVRVAEDRFYSAEEFDSLDYSSRLIQGYIIDYDVYATSISGMAAYKPLGSFVMKKENGKTEFLKCNLKISDEILKEIASVEIPQLPVESNEYIYDIDTQDGTVRVIFTTEIEEDMMPSFQFQDDWDYCFDEVRIGTFMDYNLEDAGAIPVTHGDYFGYEDRLAQGCSTYCGGNGVYYSGEASSTLDEVKYGVNNLFDSYRRDAWVEGVEGSGIGETFEITYLEDGAWNRIFSYNEMCIVNGYAKNEHTWSENNRVKSMKLYFENEYMGTITLKDTMQPQYIDLSDVNMTAGNGCAVNFKFEITEVYPGSKYDDTCISGLVIEYEGRSH